MICIVDFDGTFFKNDFFLEIFFKLLIERPLYLFKLCFKNKFKLLDIKIVLLTEYRITYDVNFLINHEVICWIKENKNRFTNFYIVSASPDFFIKYILRNQDIFFELFGSNSVNLKGVQKLKFIQQKWGSNFAYIGDSSDDIPIFKVAKEAYKIINNKIINVKSIYQVN
jgi:hypothetical protein